MGKQTQKGWTAFSKRTEPATDHKALYSSVVFIDYIRAPIRVIKVMFKDLSSYFYTNIFRTMEPTGENLLNARFPHPSKLVSALKVNAKVA